MLVSFDDMRLGEMERTGQMWISKIEIRSLAEFRLSRFQTTPLRPVDMQVDGRYKFVFVSDKVVFKINK